MLEGNFGNVFCGQKKVSPSVIFFFLKGKKFPRSQQVWDFPSGYIAFYSVHWQKIPFGYTAFPSVHWQKIPFGYTAFSSVHW